MLIPEYLYKLSARDQQVTQLELVNFGVDASAAATNVQTANYVVPNDKILIINSALMLGQAGAAQNLLRLRMSIQEITGATGTGIYARTYGAVPVGGRAFDSDFVTAMVPPQGLVFLVGNFDAGAAVNSIRMEFSGVLIPRGTFTF